MLHQPDRSDQINETNAQIRICGGLAERDIFMLASVVLSDSPSVLPADDRSTDISILAGTDIYLRTYHTALGRMQMPVSYIRAVYSIRHRDY